MTSRVVYACVFELFFSTAFRLAMLNRFKCFMITFWTIRIRRKKNVWTFMFHIYLRIATVTATGTIDKTKKNENVVEDGVHAASFDQRNTTTFLMGRWASTLSWASQHAHTVRLINRLFLFDIYDASSSPTTCGHERTKRKKKKKWMEWKKKKDGRPPPMQIIIIIAHRDDAFLFRYFCLVRLQPFGIHVSCHS